MRSQPSNPLETEVAGLRLRNPTMLASGILGTTSDILRRAAQSGAGAVVTKSVGPKPREGYPNPTVVEVGCGLLNAVGLPNPGIQAFAEEIRDLGDLEVPLIVSVYGFSPEEYAEVAEAAVEAGADAVELNLSCPHVKGAGADVGSRPELVSEIVERVKGVVDKPVFAKLTPNVSDIVGLAEAAVEAGADALTAINTLRAMAIDVETARPILSNRIGGLSGPAIKPVAVRCVYELHRELDVPIIGCGGVTSWRDAVEFMLAGASAVQVGTAVALKGLNIFRLITEGVKSYLERKGYGSVREIVGLSHRG
ncbi:MAG: dihydroorotate dehydrogenase [Candidatus Bathyarchaeota archaeon B26-1]|nr:MAG: dihydroorotate dehydrogenase [Candidatus Bathyarchaeota archaeon B26-1]